MTTFTDLQISDEIIRAMEGMGWVEPTPVQMAVIPEGLKGGDLFAQAQTGTGKTGTYGTIVLERTRAGARAPSTLVLVPTRELANQVHEELDKLSSFTGHKSIPIYGGVGIEPQIARLKKGMDIVVATPGRIRDLMDRKDLDLSKISIVVLDEADRMLDMGFARDLDHILSRVPKRRQTMLFSATMSPDIRKLAMGQMVDPQEILVSRDEPVLDLTKQYSIVTERIVKNDALTTILDKDRPKAIVFCNAKHRADRLAKRLVAQGYRSGTIHGNVAQNKREKVLKGFKDGSIRILVATDVAARGLDIEDVDLVVNFDVPNDHDTYIHRIGRTGRAGAEGMAISFFMPEEMQLIRDFERRTGKPIEPMELEIVRKPVPEVRRSAQYARGKASCPPRPCAGRHGDAARSKQLKRGPAKQGRQTGGGQRPSGPGRGGARN
jgi:ATP-dependent RNA helicase DeaD